MNRTIKRTIAAAGLVATTTVASAATDTTVNAAGATSVDFVDVTVAESLPLSGPGEVIDDSGLEAFGCLGADVDTTDVSSSTSGPITRFSGTKEFDCANGTLTITFRAAVVGCAANDVGSWRVVGGTDHFAGARGGGLLVGTYTGGAGTSCDSTGIDDRYLGVVVTP